MSKKLKSITGNTAPQIASVWGENPVEEEVGMSPFRLQKYNSYDELSQSVAQQVFTKIADGLCKHGRFVLGLASGQSPRGFIAHLLTLFPHNDIDLSHFYTVNLDEYYPSNPTNKYSYCKEMTELFWAPLAKINSGFNPASQAFIPNGLAKNPHMESIRYEQQIKKLGGIDLQILGLGVNGHIGFNEPGSDGVSRTRLITLTDETIVVNSKKFFNGDTSKVPHQAITMGIATILEAKEIFLIVTGTEKAAIFKKLLTSGWSTPENPASYLLGHKHVTILADESVLQGFIISSPKPRSLRTGMQAK